MDDDEISVYGIPAPYAMRCQACDGLIEPGEDCAPYVFDIVDHEVKLIHIMCSEILAAHCLPNEHRGQILRPLDQLDVEFAFLTTARIAGIKSTNKAYIRKSLEEDCRPAKIIQPGEEDEEVH